MLTPLQRGYRFMRGDASLTFAVVILSAYIFVLGPLAEIRQINRLGLDVVFALFLAAGARFVFEPRAILREIDDLEAHLSFLASVGSVSPYVGLFGTVWGIMHAFRGLSNMSTATLSAVAPGIAEALVATAIGLFAAIPAVVAYNRFAHDGDRIAVRFESFMEEFSNILQRQLR